jgi:crotonobetainyl-CoA:carnitine CoA-transferase CaiB-like acyl-CoA transferase
VRPRLAPEVGAQTDDVLRGAGYDESEIKQLREKGAVA